MDKSEVFDQNRYIDLTNPEIDINNYRVDATSCFNCRLSDCIAEYDGFILGRSSKGNAITICDVDFHSSTNGKYVPRLTFRRTDSRMHDKKVTGGNLFQRIDLSTEVYGRVNFWKMTKFLEAFSEVVDTGDFAFTFAPIRSDSIVRAFKTIEERDRAEFIINLANQAGTSLDEIAYSLEHSKRRNAILEFEKLLNNYDGFEQEYRKVYGVKAPGEEAVWHDFFKRNKWIFGLGLDVRIMNDFIDEPYVGSPNSNNRDNPNSDFLGISDFTSLIEIKTPSAHYFGKDRNRADSWTLNVEFLNGISQCLTQKESLISKLNGNLITDDGQIINPLQTLTVDPRIYFIYGNKSNEINIKDMTVENNIKRRTLERFIRDSRNLTVISFDELFNRAKSIVCMENSES